MKLLKDSTNECIRVLGDYFDKYYLVEFFFIFHHFRSVVGKLTEHTLYLEGKGKPKLQNVSKESELEMQKRWGREKSNGNPKILVVSCLQM